MKMVLYCCVLASISCWSTVGLSAGKPIPPKSHVETARAEVKKSYADDYKRAVTNPQPLIDKLIDAAAKEPRPADKYALFLEAEDWAARGGDYSRAIAIIDQRAAVFDCESLTECITLLQKVSKDQKVLQDADRVRDLFRQSMDAANRALARDLIDQATSAVDAAKKFARSLSAVGKKQGQPGLADEGNDRQGEASDLEKIIATRRKRQAEYLKAKDMLAKSPEDAAANWTVGRYLTFVLSKSNEGLPLLVKSGQESVVALATQELELTKAEKPDAAKLLELADAWWALAEMAKPPQAVKDARGDIRRHAAYLYDLLLPRLDIPLQKQRAKQRIDEADGDGDLVPKARAGHFKIHRLVATKQHASGWEAHYREIELIDAHTGKRLQGGRALASVPKDDPKQAEASAAMAFDGSEQTFHDTGGQPAESGHWIQYEMEFPVKVWAVRILQIGGGNHIFDVDLEGSNDGENWTPISKFKDLPDDFRTDSYNAPVPGR